MAHRDKEKARIYNAKWRAENKERHNAYNTKWREENKERFKNSVSEWRAANPERMREIRREWCAKNSSAGAAYARTRRARKRGAGGSHTETEIQFLLACQNYRCANPNCNSDLREVTKHLDHDIPICRGGTDELPNLQWLCQPCNQSKFTKTMDEFVSPPNSAPAGVSTRVMC